jgi:hypothetical protein
MHLPKLRLSTMKLAARAWAVSTVLFRDARHAWLGIGGVAFVIFVAWLLSTTLCATVRYTGTMLQILGLITVASGLIKLRRQFGRAPFIANWFRKFKAAFILPKSIFGEASSSFAFNDEAHAVLRAAPGSPLEPRVLMLEQNLDSLRAEIRQLRREFGDKIEESVQRESQQRQDGDKETAHMIEEVAVGGLHLESVGLIWLFLGVLATSIPDEIAAYVSKIL